MLLSLATPIDVAEDGDGLGREAAAPEAGDGRHARVVPAVDELRLDELEQAALGEDGVAEVEPGELDLLGMVDAELVEEPVVEGTVDLELEGADRVGDALDRVALAVGPVVGRVDAPVVAGAVVVLAADAVHEGSRRSMFGRGHVDLGPQGLRAVGELAGPHPGEEVEVLLDGAARGRGWACPALFTVPRYSRTWSTVRSQT